MDEHRLSELREESWLCEVLINDTWQKYNLCSTNKNSAPNKSDWKYLGTSRKIRIDGNEQKRKNVDYHFWRNQGRRDS